MFFLIAFIAGRLASIAQRGLWLLEVILHIGAHRTGTTSLQRALQQNQHNLKKNGVAFWGPRQTRGGRFSGLLRATDADDAETKRLIGRNRGVISLECDRLAKQGTRRLIVSEENILGSMRHNLRTSLLYPGLPTRLARFADLFGSKLTRVGLSIRPYDRYWASALAFTMPMGVPAPVEGDLDRLVTQPRSWRQVISDVARVFPGVEIAVWDFERLIGRPQAQYRVLTGGNGRIQPSDAHHNASAPREALRELLLARGDADGARAIAPGSGRYMPFKAHHIDALNARYLEDLAWLRTTSAARVNFVEEASELPAFATRIAGRGRT